MNKLKKKKKIILKQYKTLFIFLFNRKNMNSPLINKIQTQNRIYRLFYIFFLHEKKIQL